MEYYLTDAEGSMKGIISYNIEVLREIVDKRFKEGGINGLNQKDVDELVNSYGIVIKCECSQVWDKIVRGEYSEPEHALSWRDDVNANILITSVNVKRDLQYEEYDTLMHAQQLIIDLINGCGRGVYKHIEIEHNLFNDDGELTYKHNLQRVAGDNAEIYDAFGKYNSNTKTPELIVVTRERNADISKLIKTK